MGGSKMKIDVHVHILSPDFIKDIKKNLDRDAHFKLLHDNPKARFATAEDVLENMEKTGIDRSVVFGFSCLDLGMAREANDYVIETVRRYPDRFIGFAIVPPQDPGMEKELRRCREAGLKGVGEVIPAAVHTDISDQQQVERFTAVCRELDLPILMHTNEQVGHYYPGKGKIGPEQAYLFAINNPDNKIIFAHWGGGLFCYELMPEVHESLRHVYYDNAASPFLFRPQVYAAARLAGVLPKVLLGSDFPLLSPARYYKEWAATDLTEEEKRGIWGENAARFLGL
ncbi:amidohydrolase 2 [Thermacetogenium phaeum DSM 12270]|uniref:Amidohydrolase 2 n=2 Tax=Thermacetogenium phaeum TaxID=85874 RepID=K4LCY9_THEPS|nr:amidohydrolase 2 [Thermacetogenium phaeum DSM 12270]